eukprot:GFKZ01011483.1.p1 GENE.GFKZ01011483.1~~GFKZ01011483.1.p1  ORF type:complete len:695 (+),score=98.00 GFKZ01011483.1:210-2294(+)
MGKKPFSAKAKREQLRQKRQAHDPTSTPSAPSQPTLSPQTSAPRRSRPQKAAQNPHRYRLIFAEDSDAARKRHRQQAHIPISQPSITDYAARIMDVDHVRPFPDPKYAMPRRPPWSFKDSVQDVNKRETVMFDDWLNRVARPDDPLAAYFEGNLETWRQLWRVIERSDVLVLVADIRFPALHFVPDLYHYITDDLNKGMVLALNKCDLVPADVLLAWKRYFETHYPALALAMFSSFPDAKLAPSQDNSELLSRRERRMARSKLSAWGADQLLAAVETLNLEERKKKYLEQWRAQLDRTAEEDDYGEDTDVNFLEEALRGNVGISGGSHSRFVDSGNRIGRSENKETDNKVVEPKAQKKRRRRAKNVDVPHPSTSASGNGNGKKGKKETKTTRKQSPNVESGAPVNRKWQSQRDSDTESNMSEMTFDLVEDDLVRENMITIGVLGHPNAGKSSMINGVFRKKVVSTSRTPGHTKHLQTIFLSESVRLCDCPGLVFPGNAPRELQILAGMYPIAQVREPYAAIKYLAERVPLVDILKLDKEIKGLEEDHEEPGYVSETGWTAWKICEAWALKRGFRTAKAARLDVFRAANNILRLALDGRIVLATVPEGYAPDGKVSAAFGHDEVWDVHDDANACVVSASGRVAAVLSGTYDDTATASEQFTSESEEETGDRDEDDFSDAQNRNTGNSFFLLEEDA